MKKGHGVWQQSHRMSHFALVIITHSIGGMWLAPTALPREFWWLHKTCKKHVRMVYRRKLCTYPAGGPLVHKHCPTKPARWPPLYLTDNITLPACQLRSDNTRPRSRDLGASLKTLETVLRAWWQSQDLGASLETLVLVSRPRRQSQDLGASLDTADSLKTLVTDRDLDIKIFVLRPWDFGVRVLVSWEIVTFREANVEAQ